MEKQKVESVGTNLHHRVLGIAELIIPIIRHVEITLDLHVCEMLEAQSLYLLPPGPNNKTVFEWNLRVHRRYCNLL